MPRRADRLVGRPTRPEYQDNPGGVLEQPGDVVRAETVAVRRAGRDDSVEALVLHQPAERVPHATSRLDPGVDRHPLGGGPLLDRLEHGQGDLGLLLQRGVELDAEWHDRQIGRHQSRPLGAREAKGGVEGGGGQRVAHEREQDPGRGGSDLGLGPPPLQLSHQQVAGRARKQDDDRDQYRAHGSSSPLSARSATTRRSTPGRFSIRRLTTEGLKRSRPVLGFGVPIST